jgi:hypothetical protein
MVAVTVAADTKVVRNHHTDAVEMMGQKRPAQDSEVVVWIGKDRMSRDDGTTAMIVRLDQKKMYIINHEDKTVSAVDLPIDLEKLLPPGMGAAMAQMAKLDIKVTPSEETRTIGEWTAQRFDVTLSSAMMQMTIVMWIAQDVSFDTDVYQRLHSEVMAMQPGMEELASKMQEIGGFDVMSETTMSVMGAEMKSWEKVVSIESADPPAGIYEVPGGYSLEDFDFAKMSRH